MPFACSRRLALAKLFIAFIAFSVPVFAQDTKPNYPTMAPVAQYLMPRDAEIALSRSAAPDSISHDAEILVMSGQHYETAVKGTNGFVCMVLRSFTGPIDDPNFWNPHTRGPVCLNAAAARSYLPNVIRKTESALAGKTKAQMFADIESAYEKSELPPMEPGAMSYMLSKQGYLGDGVGHWHPHLMFFAPLTAGAAWGADLPGAPIYSGEDKEDRMTTFFILVPKWSDGTPEAGDHH